MPATGAMPQLEREDAYIRARQRLMLIREFAHAHHASIEEEPEAREFWGGLENMLTDIARDVEVLGAEFSDEKGGAR